MRKANPFILRNELHQVQFDLHGILLFSKSHPQAEPTDVSIDDNTSWDPKSSSKYHICRFTPDPCEAYEGLQILRDLAVMFIYQIFATGFYVLGFVAEETRTLNSCFKLTDGSRGKVGWLFVFAKQVFADHVDSFVRTLG